METLNYKKIIRKTLITYLYMFLIAPYIWGAWISIKLELISFNNFLHAITSPISIVFLGLLVLANMAYAGSNLKKSVFSTDNVKKKKLFNGIMRVHILSIIFFGTVGTFLCMLLLFSSKTGFFAVPDNMNLKLALISSLSGTALTFMFFTMFIYMHLQRFAEVFSEIKINVSAYFKICLSLVVVGIIMLFYSTYLTFDYSLLGNGVLISLIVPTMLSSFLLTMWTLKTRKKLKTLSETKESVEKKVSKPINISAENLTKSTSNFKKTCIEQQTSEIKKTVSVTSEMFYYTQNERESLKLQAIKKAFEFHYNNNKFYNQYCTQSGNFKPEDIQTLENLKNIPVIPIEYFREGKTDALLTIPHELKQLELRAKGAGGSESVVYRDSYSSELCINMLVSMYMEVLDMNENYIPCGLFLTPSVKDTPHLGMLRALTPLNVFFADQTFIVKGKNLDFEKAVSFLDEMAGKFPPYIIAPPFLLDLFLKYLKSNNLKYDLSQGTRIITAGGWKRGDNQVLTRQEIDDQCLDRLNVKIENIRDTFGLIECNQFSIECNHRSKHIPPHTEFYTRNINDSNIVCKEGEEGRIVILDPTVLTYPAFISTQDVGVVNTNVSCECGRSSSTVNLVGRMPNTENVNCSITLGQHIEEEPAEENVLQL